MTEQPERAPSLVFPVITLGPLNVAHLATATLDLDEGAGYQVICPAAALIVNGVRRAEPVDVLIWCHHCQEWAAAAGVVLPQTGNPPAGG